MQIQKGYTGTDSDGDSYAKSQWKLGKFHLIGIFIGAKIGTAAIGIGIGTYIGIGIGSLETLLHIIFIVILIGIGIGIGIAIRVGQWKHTMKRLGSPGVIKISAIHFLGIFLVNVTSLTNKWVSVAQQSGLISS